jgi:hypothetical protein
MSSSPVRSAIGEAEEREFSYIQFAVPGTVSGCRVRRRFSDWITAPSSSYAVGSARGGGCMISLRLTTNSILLFALSG